MNWIMSRVKEMSSWSGAGLIGLYWEVHLLTC